MDLTISDNEIMGGYYGIRLYGSFGGRNENEISGNTLSEHITTVSTYTTGTDVTISQNTGSNFGSNFAYGIYPYQVDGAVINGEQLLRYTMVFTVTT